MTNLLQLKAADPNSSIWVSASAGTGKTKILTDRVLRLLLRGENLNKILCLTFTNAAAAEMKERITRSLLNWSSLNEDELRCALHQATGEVPSKKEITVAHNLYDQYLRSGENINVQTIHSFCQKILKKFPLEAKISPSFQIIDENKERSILQEIKNILIKQDDLTNINEYLATNFHELIIDEIFGEIIQNKTKFHQQNSTTDDILSESKTIIDELNTDINDYFVEFLQNPNLNSVLGYNYDVSQVRGLFLTSTGEKKKRISYVKIVKPNSPLQYDLLQLQEQFYQLDQQVKNKNLRYFTYLINLLSTRLLQEYEIFKSQKGLLDYDDLIEKSCLLLNNSDAREWVLYKLDGFINHLLVDEAQDTSPHQWNIINALITEFYAGQGSEEEQNRTIFVVGDAKQSIFSFQGANIDVFAKTNIELAQKMYYAQKKFSNVDLEISYRSTQEIIDVVGHVFHKQYQQNPELFSIPMTKIQAHRSAHKGLVELWPLCINDEKLEEFWPIKEKSSSSSKTKLAHKISAYIKNLLSSKIILPSTNQPIRHQDIMILFRKRDDLIKEVICSLQQNGLSCSGLDRIVLKDNLSVRDLLSVARFVLNPDDDLNLASLILSPIFNYDNRYLYEISTARQRLSIWQFIQNEQAKYQLLYQKLSQFIHLYLNTNSIEFFHNLTDRLGLRAMLNSYNGSSSDDAINELLYSCNNYVKQFDDSLQNFVFWLNDSESSIKRETLSQNQIQIMTTHASKGLQAPVVIMCDTTSLPHNSDRFFWSEDQFIASKHPSDVSEDFIAIKNNHNQQAYAEYLRLLYVGMTRAEDHLIICGYQGDKSLPENCWYQLVKNALNELKTHQADDILFYGNKDLITTSNIFQQSEKMPEPTQVIDLNYVNDIFLEKTVSIVNIDNIKCKINLQKTGINPLFSANPLEYGLVFHKILEDTISASNVRSLAEPDSDRQKSATKKSSTEEAFEEKSIDIMNDHPLIMTLKPRDQKRIKNSIEKIISNQQFCSLLSFEVMTEVNIGKKGNNDEQIEFGRIDLLIKKPKEIIIVDYKSDISPPISSTAIPLSYRQQLLKYKLFCQELYPNHNIITKILWLENGQLMTVI